MKIQHNLLAMNANRNSKIVTGIAGKTMEKLSSGYKINRAADDAAGLSISEKMRRQIRGLSRASDNCQDGISMVQTAEGALAEVHDMLQRLNELAVQAANGTNSQADRDAIQMEVEQIQEEIDRVSETTTFNSMRLFAEGDGSTTNGTNNGNTPSVTSLDASAQTPAVMSMRSMPRAAGVTCGAFTVSGGTEGTDFSFADGVLSIKSGANLTVTGTGIATTDKIVIQDGVDANVTINNVNIDVSTVGGSAMEVGDTASLNLTLAGTNTLNGVHPGLQVENGASLTITEQSTGSLKATGGLYAAAIGSRDGKDAGNIEIRGGTIEAIGGQSAAAIGGGYTGAGGNITISGGNVNVRGGSKMSYPCAAIGGGLFGASGTFSTGVNGNATITAVGGASSIGAYDIADTSNQANWSGKINYMQYPENIIDLSTLKTDIVVHSDYYETDGQKYMFTGDYVFTGDTTKKVTIQSTTADITFKNATMGRLSVGGAGTANVTLEGTNAVNGITVNGNCLLDVSGSGTLQVNGISSVSANGTFNIGNGITIENNKTMTNSGTITNEGTIKNSNKISNSGTFDNSSGVIINDGGTVSGAITGNQPILAGSGTIDLSTLTGALEITSSGYRIGTQEYGYTGSYTFTGDTTQEITVSSNANITLDGVNGSDFKVTNNSTANVTLVGNSNIDNVTVDSGSKLNTTGSGTLQITNSLDNDGTLNNDAAIENAGTMENSGTITNKGTINNDGTLQNDGTINNNAGGTIDTTNGTFDNSNGTINDNGGTFSGTITGNQPVTGGGGNTTGGTGSAKNSWWIQAGADAGVGISIEIGAMDTKVLGIEKGIVTVKTEDAAGDAITAVGNAIEKLSKQRSRLGAYQNRLEHTILNLDNVVENTTAAESRIRDADMAKEMVDHAKNNILMQAVQTMLSQANAQPEAVLQLLQ